MKTLLVAIIGLSVASLAQAQVRVIEANRFTFQGEFVGHASPALLKNGSVIVTNEYGSTWLLDSSGKPIRKILDSDNQHSRVSVLENGQVTVMGSRGDFYLLNPDGSESYHFNKGYAWGYGGVPTVLSNGNLVFGGQLDGNRNEIVVVGHTGKELNHYSLLAPSYSDLVATPGGALIAVDDKGTIYRLDPEGTKPIEVIEQNKLYLATVEVATEKAIVVMGSQHGETPQEGRVYNENGLPAGSIKLPFYPLDRAFIAGVCHSDWICVAIDHEKLYFFDQDMKEIIPPVELEYTKSKNNQLFAVKTPNRGLVVVINNTLYFFDKARHFVSQSILPGNTYGGLAFLSDGTVVTGSSNGFIYFVDPSTGELKAFYKTTGVISNPILAAKDDTVIVGNSDGYVQFLKLVK